MPGAIHESFKTVGEASRSFAQARDNGVTKAVDPESRLETPPLHEDGRASQSRSSQTASETLKTQRSLPRSPSNMGKAQAALFPAMFQPNMRTSSFSSSRATPVAKQRITSHSPRVIVRTPSDIPSYPNDTEEPSSPTALSRSFSDNLSLGKQASQEKTSSFTSIALKTSRPMDDLSALPDSGVSQPTLQSMKPHLRNLTLGSLDSPQLFTPEDMSPLISFSPMRGNHSNVLLSSSESSSCPKCGFTSELKPFCVPEMSEETSPELSLDPRSPLNQSGFRFGSQFGLVFRVVEVLPLLIQGRSHSSCEGKGRPSPDMKVQPSMSLLLST